ncbi:CBS domain-containing protein [Bradyrhizobium icense]|uniref:CBS domain-containing protein n=1 Tax=Bradyrhizobium icense TaxID=1274631 RepID=A0A1B1UC45_9BRAD|nr:CBS domain-containing protein [Bradyrhizobium icense]ANW00324.1 CBS domain-containing protein [Bradyrhizobium icense]
MLATEIMRSSFATVKPTTSALDTLRLLLETNQRGLPVIDDAGALVGMVSEGDFLHRQELGVSCPEGFWFEWLFGREKGQVVRERMYALRIDAVMSRNPVCLDETATIDDVVSRMDEHRIAQVLMVRAGKVIGIVGRLQLLTALERCLSREENNWQVG